MAESSINFSIITDETGKLKVHFDGATKSSSDRISPCSSLKSLNITEDTESIHIGTRRRAPSISSESVSTYTTENDVIQRTSTPLLFEDDSESLSDISFASCTSEFSAITNSSQETVTSASKIMMQEKRKPISYEQKNKERYGYTVEDDWRSKMKTSEEMKSTPPVRSRNSSYSSSKTHSAPRTNIPNNGSGSSNRSRIPSLMDRRSSGRLQSNPTPSRPLPSNRVNNVTGSYAVAASKNSSSHCNSTPLHSVSTDPISTKQSTIKMNITTDSNGNMKINFSNSQSSESWSIEGINVQKILDSNNNN